MAKTKTKTAGRAALKNLAKNDSSPKKKKSKVAHAEIDKDTAQLVADYRDAHGRYKDAKAEMAALKEDIIPEGAKQLTASVAKNGFHSSICLGGMINFTSQNKYSAMSEDAVNEVFTEEERDSLFEEQLKISLKSNAQTDEVLNKLVRLLGEDNLSEWFDIELQYKPTGQFHEKRWSDPEIGKKVQKAKKEGFITTNDQLRVVR